MLRPHPSISLWTRVTAAVLALPGAWYFLSRPSASQAPPATTGLAAKYPADRGIARDPAVSFAEDFEAGTLDEVVKRWGEASNKDGKVLTIANDAPPASGGRRCLQVTATAGQNTGGHLYTRLPRGADQLYARFYVRFAPDADYLHHFVHLGGYHPATPYPQGGAGERPRGDDRVTVGIEPYGAYGQHPPPGAWNFYAYWQEMKVSAGGRYWGNAIHPPRPALVPKDRWQCVEVLLRLNSAPEKADGELALWLDGKETMRVAKGARRGPWTGMGFALLEQGGEPFEGFRFRTTNDLKLNFFWLLHYVTENAARQNGVPEPPPRRPAARVPPRYRPNRVWFDNVVVSTSYVGPVG